MIFVSCLHLGLKDKFYFDYPTRTTLREKAFTDRWHEVVNYAQQLGECIIVCGDVFDSNDPNTRAHTLFLCALDYAEVKGVAVYVIPGNHDVGVFENALSVGEKMSDRIITYSPKQFDIEGKRVLFIPAVSKNCLKNWGGWEKFLIKDSYQKVDIIVSHAQARFRNENDTETNYYVFDRGTWPKAPLYVFGHDHTPFCSREGDYTILCPGSMLQCDYGERFDTKGFYRISGEVTEFIPYKSNGYDYRDVEIEFSKGVWGVFPLLKDCQDRLVVAVDVGVGENADMALLNEKLRTFNVDRVIVFGKENKRKLEKNSFKKTVKKLSALELLTRWLDKEKVSPTMKKIALKVGEEVLQCLKK